MHKFVLQLDASIKEAKLSLLDMFKLIDCDDSGSIEVSEFHLMFKNMKLNLEV